MPIIGRVAAIWRYPVKSLRGEPLTRVRVEESGLEGDRVTALLVRDGHVRAGKTYRGKENDRLHLLSDADAAVRLAREAGVTVDVRHDERSFDDAPVSLIADRWLEGLRAYVGYEVEPERFRPNFFVRADASFDASEESLTGALVSVGNVTLRVRGPIERCVVTTYEPSGGPSDPRILRYVAQERNALMGVYCDVVAPGTAALDDAVSAAEP
jgi:uncharacterized protein